MEQTGTRPQSLFQCVTEPSNPNKYQFWNRRKPLRIVESARHSCRSSLCMELDHPHTPQKLEATSSLPVFHRMALTVRWQPVKWRQLKLATYWFIEGLQFKGSTNRQRSAAFQTFKFVHLKWVCLKLRNNEASFLEKDYAEICCFKIRLEALIHVSYGEMTVWWFNFKNDSITIKQRMERGND